MQADIEKAVAVHDIVALAILHGEHSALDIGRKGCCHLMHRAAIAAAEQKELAVIKGLLSYPLLQGKPILALVDIGTKSPVLLPRPLQCWCTKA